MDDIHIGALCVALVVLIGCSAFFSGSETGLMTMNRYRLRHRAKAGDKAAQRASRLLERPDRLIGLILLTLIILILLLLALLLILLVLLIVLLLTLLLLLLLFLEQF